MGVEIILDEDDRLGFGEVDIGQVFQNLGLVPRQRGFDRLGLSLQAW